MAPAQEELRRAVLAVLPDLPAETLTTLMAGLEELGVENKEDMSLLSEENLLPFLRVVQSRKILSAFSSQGNHRLGGFGVILGCGWSSTWSDTRHFYPSYYLII